MGTHTFPNGAKYVGEFRDGTRNGRGILYGANGSIEGCGSWENGKLVKFYALDTNQFPLNPPSQVAGNSPLPTTKTEASESQNNDIYSVSVGITSPFRFKIDNEIFVFVDKKNGVLEIEATDLNVSLKDEMTTSPFRNSICSFALRVMRLEDGRYKVVWQNEPVVLSERLKIDEGINYSLPLPKQRFFVQERDFSSDSVKFVLEVVTDSGNESTCGGAYVYASSPWLSSALSDPSRFLLNPPSRVAASQPLDPGKAEGDRLAAEVEAERKKREELEKKIAEAKEREQRTTTPAQVASPRNPHALIIGNAAYPGSARLDNPINDANAVAQKLKTMGFTVTVVTDANRQRLVQAMSNFRKTASSADLSLLFYSGHGVQIFGTNYILPTDADQTDVAQATIQGVSLNSVVENFLPGKTKIVFLDACRDNPLQRIGERTVSKGLAPISVAQGTLIAYATKDGQTASDGVGQKNSPFTKALLEHLSDPQDIAVILRKVREKVMTATGGKQQPWEYGSLTGGELVLSGVKR